MLGLRVNIDKNSLKVTKWVVLVAFIIVTFGMTFFSDDLLTNVFGLVILCLAALLVCRFNPISPYFWFSCFFTLYSISYPILHYMRFTEFVSWGYSPELMRCQWLGLTTFLLVFSPTSSSPKLYSFNNKVAGEKLFFFSKTNKIVLYVLVFLLLAISLKLALSGYTSKKQIQAAGDIFFSIGERLAMFLAIDFSLYFASNLNSGKKIKSMLFDIIFCSVPILAFVLFTGDRSSLFRLVFYLGASLFAFGRLKSRHLLIIVPLMIVALAASNVFRYVLMKQGTSFSFFTNYKDFLYDFLTSDFHCAGRNLQVLINNSNTTKGAFGYSLIFNDILFVFFRNIGLFSASSWFNKTYFSGSIYGQAFSLVGEGYLMDGYLGIVVLFSIIALLVKWLYSLSNKNIYLFVIYVVASAGICFAFREMLMSVLSPIIRQCIPVLAIVYLLNKTGVHSYSSNTITIKRLN